MEPKSLNQKAVNVALAATINPAAFPIGSPESRAAARALLSKRTELSADDQDCLLVYRLAGKSLHDVTGTAVYQRGKQIAELRDKPITPWSDEERKRYTSATMVFRLNYGRDPQPGDVVTYSDVLSCISFSLEFWEVEQSWCKEVWQRQGLPWEPREKVENGKRYHCLPNYHGGGGMVWEADWFHDPDQYWHGVEHEALSELQCDKCDNAVFGKPIPPSHIDAVIFVDDGKGGYTLKPHVATEKVRS